MQRTPALIADAFAPVPTRLGTGATLQPLTLGHCLWLDRLETGALQHGAVTGLALYRALFILAQPHTATGALWAVSREAFDDAVIEYAQGLGAIEEQLLSLLLFAHVNRAFTADKQREYDGGGLRRQSIDECYGLGWWLALVARLMEMPSVSTLLRSDAQTLMDLSVATAFAITTADDIRNGYEWSEPSYVGEERLAAAEKTGAHGQRERDSQRAESKAESEKHHDGGTSQGNEHAGVDQASSADGTRAHERESTP